MRKAASILAALFLATCAFAQDAANAPEPTPAPAPDATGTSASDAAGTTAPDAAGTTAPDAAGTSASDAAGTTAPDAAGTIAPDAAVAPSGPEGMPVAEPAIGVVHGAPPSTGGETIELVAPAGEPQGDEVTHGEQHGQQEVAAGEQHGEQHGEHGEAAHAVNYLPKFVNFAIFAGFLFYLLYKPARAFFATRRADIGTSLSQAEAAQQQAQSKLVEMEARLAALDQQVKDILAKAGEQAVAEKDLIIQEARLAAKKILAQAESQVADLEAASARRLKAMAADLAVEAAREIVEKQLKPEDRSRFFDRTLKGLQKVSN